MKQFLKRKYVALSISLLLPAIIYTLYPYVDHNDNYGLNWYTFIGVMAGGFIIEFYIFAKCLFRENRKKKGLPLNKAFHLSDKQAIFLLPLPALIYWGKELYISRDTFLYFLSENIILSFALILLSNIAIRPITKKVTERITYRDFNIVGFAFLFLSVGLLFMMQKPLTQEDIINLTQNLPTNKTSLNLSRKLKFSEDFKTLIEGLENKNIQEIDISHNNLQDQDIQELAKLLENGKIKSLNISNNAFSIEGVKLLAKSLKKSSLLYLRLNNNSLNDAAFILILESLRNTNIKVINVSGNHLTNAFVETFLSIFPSITNLKKIDLSHNYLDFEGIYKLQKIRRENLSIVLNDNNSTID